MTEITFQGINRNLRQTSSLNSNRLHLVIEEGGCAMSIDETDVLGLHALQGFLQTGIEPFACLTRRTDMKGIILDIALSYLPSVFARRQLHPF